MKMYCSQTTPNLDQIINSCNELFKEKLASLRWWQASGQRQQCRRAGVNFPAGLKLKIISYGWNFVHRSCSMTSLAELPIGRLRDWQKGMHTANILVVLVVHLFAM